MTDENGKPLHTAMLYTDPRGEEECKALTEKFGARELAGITVCEHIRCTVSLK